MFKIDAVDMPIPSKITVSYHDVDLDSQRNLEATMIRYKIAEKTKLNLEWKGLHMDKTSLILNAVEPKFVDITYADPKKGVFTTKTFYAGDRVVPIFTAIDDNYIWESLTFSLTEA